MNFDFNYDNLMPLHIAVSLFAGSFSITLGIYMARGIAVCVRRLFDLTTEVHDGLL
jgi:hypothetical protein